MLRPGMIIDLSCLESMFNSTQCRWYCVIIILWSPAPTLEIVAGRLDIPRPNAADRSPIITKLYVPEENHQRRLARELERALEFDTTNVLDYNRLLGLLGTRGVCVCVYWLNFNGLINIAGVRLLKTWEEKNAPRKQRDWKCTYYKHFDAFNANIVRLKNGGSEKT